MVAVQPPPQRIAIVDPRTGMPTLAFRDFIERLWQRSGGAGDIVLAEGPEVSTNNAIARFNGTTGNVQDSGVIIDDSDNMTGMTTVDGRDVSVDGGKLDGIEASADVNDVDSVFTRTGAVVAVRGDYRGGDVTRGLEVFETTVGQAALASAGTVTLLNATSGEQWKVREIFLSGDGTDFSGGGGDRLLDIKEGSTVYSVVPAATLQSLSPARWGDTGVPFPATPAHLTTATTAGEDIVAAYSGGSTDYTAGELTIVLVAERVT